MTAEAASKRGGKAARNERRKALATTFSAVGIAMLAAALIQPLVTEHWPRLSVAMATLIAFIATQVCVHYILDRLED